MKSPGEFNLKRIFQLIKDKFDALATVANTGDYDDLSNAPEIVEAQTITLSTVATSGNYEDLSNKPTIPTISNDFTNAYKSKLDGIAAGAEVNVQSDWNAISGDAVILNKPTITQVKMKTWTSDDIGGGS